MEGAHPRAEELLSDHVQKSGKGKILRLTIGKVEQAKNH
jgi:hypothetical protein